MSRSYQQYLRTYAHVLSGGLVKSDPMSVDGLDVLAIAIGVAHAKRDTYNPAEAQPMSVSEFAEVLDEATGEAKPAPAC